MHRLRGHSYPKAYKQTRFSELDTPSSSDFSFSEWDESYTLDTDDDLDKHRLPRFSSLQRRYSGRGNDSAPEVKKVSVKLPTSTADDLRSNEVLVLPALVHLHILIRLPCARTEELRAAAPASMAFGDLAKQVVRAYVADGIRSSEIQARVEQRGRLKDPPRETALEELAHRGEVYRDGRMEMKVEITVGDDGERERVTARFGGRGPRGGEVDIEKVYQRSESRFRAGVRR